MGRLFCYCFYLCYVVFVPFRQYLYTWQLLCMPGLPICSSCLIFFAACDAVRKRCFRENPSADDARTHLCCDTFFSFSLSAPFCVRRRRCAVEQRGKPKPRVQERHQGWLGRKSQIRLLHVWVLETYPLCSNSCHYATSTTAIVLEPTFTHTNNSQNPGWSAKPCIPPIP